MKVPAECTHFRRFHWTFVLVDPPPIKLFHLGRKEVDFMLSLLEYDLMTFDPQLFGQAGAVPSYTSDPSQKFGIRSTMPKSTPPKKLEQIQNQESESHLMESVYELRSCQQYLKVNSANPKCPLTMFPVSGCLHSMIVKFLDENACTGRHL